MRILVSGTFDLLHPGHEYFLEEAAKRGAITVLVARDVNVQRIKGRLPVQSEQERRSAILERFPYATVILGHETDFMVRVREVEPDLIILGYDQQLPPGMTEADLPCPTERVGAFKPEEYKSSVRRKQLEA